ncbi:MAG: type I-C CRISPR-associated protein Cas8c/Csd1 [Pseudomonadota bacterium]|nr:type I-C CRISPR-associated protein Cas8c/Csd1 [Pseudomonadota bacterium]
MSWLQTLYETYESCKGREPAGSAVLMPIGHTTQQAHIEIVLDGQGNFRRASVLEKGAGTTLIPCTEESGGRAGSKPVNHPLCDKLQYLAGDFVKFGGEVTSGFAAAPEEPHREYLASLRAWASSGNGHSKLDAIHNYVQRGRVIEDLAASKILLAPDGKLLKTWEGEKDQTPAIYKSLPAGQVPEDAFVRWSVEETGNPASGTWQDDALIEAWIAHYASTQTRRGYCMVRGEQATLAVQHPAKLRNAGDKAKLISANDNTGYTFRGRFVEAGEAASVGFEVTQKAHNALRWLIARQGSRNGDQAIVSWAVSGQRMPDPMASTYDLLGIEPSQTPDAIEPVYTGQAFALRLSKAINGYRATLDPAENVVVMGLDSATPGRMAITYYREIRGSEFLERIEAWHLKCGWPQNFGKDTKFVGAPAPRDIAQAAYGRRLDEKLEKATRERLLSCIVDGSPIPLALIEATKRRTINRVGLDRWEWEKCLGIACALFKGQHTERNYQMALELKRTSRDYLYGRLLAIAEHIEGRALYLAGEKRETTASRLMQRFADRPNSAWRNIELALVPYKTRLRNLRPGFLHAMERELDDVMAAFEGDSFTSDGALSGEFLLSYHCQRQALRPADRAADEDESTDTTDSTTGDTP